MAIAPGKAGYLTRMPHCDDVIPPPLEPGRANSRGHALLWPWIGAVLLAAGFVTLRARWIGHLLTWDEAMNLLTVRSLTAGGSDFYSLWFWRHPPLFHLFTTLLDPLRPGFAERAEWLTLGWWTAGLIPFYILNRRAFGTGVALTALFCLAVMPGAVFFGTWIKEEPLVILFGTSAMLWFNRRRYGLAGLALGLAFLSKELALFYALAVAVLWGLRSPQERRGRELATTAAATLLTAAWWYLWFSVSVRHFWRFATGDAAAENVNWSGSWHYYFDKLPGDLGWVGVGWLVAGTLVTGVGWWHARQRRVTSPQPPGPTAKELTLWPLAMLLPALVVISAARGKTPWLTLTLYPAMATLQALGLVAVLRGLPRWLPQAPRAVVRGVAAMIVAVTAAVLTVPRLGDSYEALAGRQSPILLTGARLSAQAATAMNFLVHDGERVLLTPMNYWNMGPAPAPCPIFVYYFRPAPVVVRPNTLSAAELAGTVRDYQIDWAMLSPAPGAGERDLLLPLVRDFGLRPAYRTGVCVFRTTPLWRQASPAASPEAAPPRP